MRIKIGASKAPYIYVYVHPTNSLSTENDFFHSLTVWGLASVAEIEAKSFNIATQ
jgi:hypothetical protein